MIGEDMHEKRMRGWPQQKKISHFSHSPPKGVGCFMRVVGIFSRDFEGRMGASSHPPGRWGASGCRVLSPSSASSSQVVAASRAALKCKCVRVCWEQIGKLCGDRGQRRRGHRHYLSSFFLLQPDSAVWGGLFSGEGGKVLALDQLGAGDQCPVPAGGSSAT